jgi:hypothetical protein
MMNAGERRITVYLADGSAAVAFSAAIDSSI